MASSKPAIPDPTEIAGRYAVDKKLGAGAFGTVYKAKDKILKRMVAIKTIRLEGLAAQGAGLEEMLKRFEREAQVSATLKHPHIVTIHDLGNADGLSYLAMEFIDGVGLEKIISQGALPAERAAGLGAQVADALDFAHKHGVIHRDIKPANIMVEAGDRVKVTDFGIAKATESPDHLTMTGSLLGTPSYMSPEQARGGTIDGRSDLFSVGCVLYEMIAGRKAFRGESITALIFKIITEEPPPLREVAPDAPEALLRIVEKALAKAPEARYQSGRELAEDLNAFVRAGNVPTIRESESPTVPAPAMQASPTVAVPRTLSEAPTQQDIATRVAPPPPPRPAPVVSAPPPLPRPPAPPRTPPLPRTPPAAAAAARKSGGGAGLLIGIGVLGLGFVAMVVVGGWYVFLRKPADTPPTTMAATVATTPPSTVPEVTTPATVPPASMATPPPPTSLAVAPPTVPAAPPATQATAPSSSKPAAKAPRTADSRGQVAPPDEAPPAEEEPSNAFLDHQPPEIDGREAGGRVAEGFRSPSTRGSGFGTSRALAPRELSPAPHSPAENFAIRAVRNVMNAQTTYNQKNGRFGSLGELARAGILPLANVQNGNSFTHRAYRFEVEAAGDRFRVLATPREPRGPRTFVGDESGYIRDAAKE